MLEVEQKFNEEMRQIYDKSKELTPPYKPTRFKKMLDQYGGIETANRLLISSSKIPDGFIELYSRGPEALKLTVEYLILKPEYSVLFNPDQHEIAKKRLKQLNIELP
jgi:hypothetical protein